jgi:hypothetical protein
MNLLKIRRATETIATFDAANHGYRHQTYTFTPDGKTVISGGANGHLTAYDAATGVASAFVGHSGYVWATAVTEDGRVAASGSDDGIINLWNLSTHELIISMFYGQGGTWVMWTPQGFYASSPGGDALVGWQINHGPDKAAEYVTGAQLRKKLNRPDIVARAIALASAKQAVKEATGATFKIADLLAQPVPKLKITPFAQGFVARGGSAKIEVAIDKTPGPVKALRIQVNGRQIAEEVPQAGGIAPGKRSYTVPLAKGENTVAVIAINDIGEATDKVEITHDGDGLLDNRGALYILAIGADKYPGLPGNDLHYSGGDARAFAEVMEKSAGTLHRKIVKRVLANGADAADEPTRENIIDALSDLKQASEADTILLFVAGHGENRGLDYYFIPSDATWRGEELRESTLVPWDRFQRAVESAKGARFMFLDTCHSGNAYNPRALNESVNANILVYTATRWDQAAHETTMFGEGHGLFTLALAEGVRGKAKTAGGEIRAEPLHAFLRARIAEYVRAANEKIEGLLETQPSAKLSKLTPQEPQFFKGRDAGNYLLAIAN